MYKEGLRSNVRFQTTKGLLSIEQLFSLDKNDLNTLVVSLEQQYEESKGKTYLRVKTKKDKTLKLMFDIALDVLNTKLDDEELATNASEIKKKTERALAIRAKVTDANEEERIANMSEKEFNEYLKQLK
jgi:hypothetical protein